MANKTRIAAFGQEFAGKHNADQDLAAEDIVVAGDRAIVRSLYDITVAPKARGNPTKTTGRNQLILRRQADNSLKTARVVASKDK